MESDLDGGGPVGVHLSILVVVTLELELQVRSETNTSSCETYDARQTPDVLPFINELINYSSESRLPHDESFVDGVAELEDVVADGQVVL